MPSSEWRIFWRDSPIAARIRFSFGEASSNLTAGQDGAPNLRQQGTKIRHVRGECGKQWVLLLVIRAEYLAGGRCRFHQRRRLQQFFRGKDRARQGQPGEPRLRISKRSEIQFRTGAKVID